MPCWFSTWGSSQANGEIRKQMNKLSVPNASVNSLLLLPSSQEDLERRASYGGHDMQLDFISSFVALSLSLSLALSRSLFFSFFLSLLRCQGEQAPKESLQLEWHRWQQRVPRVLLPANAGAGEKMDLHQPRFQLYVAWNSALRPRHVALS